MTGEAAFRPGAVLARAADSESTAVPTTTAWLVPLSIELGTITDSIAVG
jgi:hypothetical protein